MESFSNESYLWLVTVLATAAVSNLSEITDHYNNVLSEVLDKHAPEKSKVITIRPAAPWYSEEITGRKNSEESLNVVGTRLNALMITMHMQYSVDACSFYY